MYKLLVTLIKKRVYTILHQEERGDITTNPINGKGVRREWYKQLRDNRMNDIQGMA